MTSVLWYFPTSFSTYFRAAARTSVFRPTLDTNWNDSSSAMSLLKDFWELLAAPKRKTTRAYKMRRKWNRGIEPLQNISSCKLCGKPMLKYHYCNPYRCHEAKVRLAVLEGRKSTK
ncbi:hypothetical protein Gasu2_00110 [Galdieria sulphuraria]|uniref:Uncharacterized protein n=1 Tax=Galdieria sulphuraria TaxID=130081 RepID=M2XSQ9_GALSU|nr:uncharacterized protein Gasu_57120 [Galdieria sulphuraria]EME26708.1 hypothetical protein Gasu_57120 [Galdieria sulphuraria]GJD05546.1 hypothetical protein Gasu2_00110 [Galdieria sulphuraria]|eukprot:XP_005703228.1 hypothetical protein Gasu_57120 [Galdieria sulphuraria]